MYKCTSTNVHGFTLTQVVQSVKHVVLFYRLIDDSIVHFAYGLSGPEIFSGVD